jgi:hypothetical protein
MQEKLLEADAYEIGAHGAKKSSRGKPLEHKKSVIYNEGDRYSSSGMTRF